MKPLHFGISLFLLLVVTTCATQSESSRTILNSENNSLHTFTEEDQAFNFEEGERTNSRMLGSRTTEPVGIISRLNLGDHTMTLSRNGKIAFVTQRTAGILQVLDVSDPASPTTISSLKTKLGALRSSIISPDEKLLYTYAIGIIEIFNITDPYSPTLLGDFEFSCLDRTLSNPYPVFVVTSDGKIGIMSLGSIEIFDLSNPKSIQRVYTLVDSKQRTIALRKDEKRLLVYGEGTIQILDFSKPSSPVFTFSASSSDTNAKPLGPILVTYDDKKAYIPIATQYYDGSTKKFNTVIEVLDLVRLDRDSQAAYAYPGIFPREVFYSPGIVFSSDESYMYICRDSTLTIRDVWYGGSSVTTPYQIGMIFSVAVSPDNRIAYLSTASEMVAVKLYVDLPIKFGQVYNLASSEKARYREKDSSGWVNLILLASNQKKIYLSMGSRVESYEFGSGSVQNFQRYVSNQGDHPLSFELSKDESFLVVTHRWLITILDTNELQTRASYNVYEKGRFVSSRVCPDQKTLYIIELLREEPVLYLTIYDISSITNLKKLKSTRVDHRSAFQGVYEEAKISPDCKTLFFIYGNVSIFDISNPESPVHSISLLEYTGSDMAFSHQGSIAFLANFNEPALFTIIDFSDHKDIKIVSQTPTIITTLYSDWTQSIIVSEDDKTVFTVGRYGVIGFDVSDLSNPKVTLTLAKDKVHGVQLSKDKKTLFLGLEEGTVALYDSFSKTNLYVPMQNINLGDSYSNNLEVLKTNVRGTYVAYDKPYKFAKMSLYNPMIGGRVKIMPTSSALPSWMYFDKENGVLTIEPKSVSHLGSFEISTVVSTEVSIASFQSLPKVNDAGSSQGGLMNAADANHLLITLISIGYIDNERFLTASFNPTMTLQLSTKYESIETEIRKILTNSYQEHFSRITVSPSLTLSKMKSLTLETSFPNSLSVVITLDHKEPEKKPGAQFVTRTYAGVLATNTNQKTRLTLDGSLSDINNALREIAINVTSSSFPCDGKIVISDGYNPTITQNIKNISKHVNINQAPLENEHNTIKSQISRYNFVKGDYFMIELSPNSFIEANPESLEYHLKMPNSDKKIPSWISQYGLQITGTVPEDVLTSSFDLVLVAKNEFRSTEVPFKMEFHASSFYLLKVVLKYGSYLASAITLYFILNQILNIIGAKYYRHPKRFVIPVGHPITAQNIFPIFFAAEEIKIAEYVQDRLFRKVANDYGKKKLTDLELVKHFVKENNLSLDEGKIWKGIEEVISKLDLQNHEDLKYTAKRVNSCKNMIKKIIFYDLVNKKIRLYEEKETRAVYNSIVKDWVELIDYNSTFVVNDFKLLKKLPSRRAGENLSISGLLHLEKENVNLGLLKHAIAGHAFKYHLMDLRINDVNINIMERVHRNSPWLKIKKLLKKDEETIPSNERGKAVYGIEYSIKGNTLLFSGVPEEIFAGRALAVQIVTKKGRILRELSVLGCDVAPLFGKTDEVTPSLGQVDDVL